MKEHLNLKDTKTVRTSPEFKTFIQDCRDKYLKDFINENKPNIDDKIEVSAYLYKNMNEVTFGCYVNNAHLYKDDKKEAFPLEFKSFCVNERKVFYNELMQQRGHELEGEQYFDVDLSIESDGNITFRATSSKLDGSKSNLFEYIDNFEYEDEPDPDDEW